MGKWDQRYIDLAKHISSWSKDPSTKVGAVIVDTHNRIVSTGFNGFPTKVSDTLNRLEDRPMKYEMMIHAEMNALMFARQTHDCTIYVSSLPPCARCSTLIIQSGITRVVSPSGGNNTKWDEQFLISKEMFNEANIRLDIYTDI